MDKPAGTHTEEEHNLFTQVKKHHLPGAGTTPLTGARLIAAGPDAFVYRIPDHTSQHKGARCLKIYRPAVSDDALNAYAHLLEDAALHLDGRLTSPLRMNTHGRTWDITYRIPPHAFAPLGDVRIAWTTYIEGPTLAENLTDTHHDIATHAFTIVSREENEKLMYTLGYDNIGFTQQNTKYRVREERNELLLVATDLCPSIAQLHAWREPLHGTKHR